MAHGAAAATHVVLIRGIKVGGKNPEPMARLCAALMAAGVDDARIRPVMALGKLITLRPQPREDAFRIHQRLRAAERNEGNARRIFKSFAQSEYPEFCGEFDPSNCCDGEIQSPSKVPPVIK